MEKLRQWRSLKVVSGKFGLFFGVGSNMGLKTIAVNIYRRLREVCMTSGAKKTLQFGAVIGTRSPWTRNNNCVIVNKCELGLCTCNFTVLTKRIFNPPSCVAWRWQMAMICGQKINLPSYEARQLAMICGQKTDSSSCVARQNDHDLWSENTPSSFFRSLCSALVYNNINLQTNIILTLN